MNLGQFVINDSNIVNLEGKQRDAASCLVDHGKDDKICWDEIYELFKSSEADQCARVPANGD